MKLDKYSEPTARRVHQRGKMQKASFLTGPKIRGRIQTESTLEATFACVAMLDPRVEEIRPQPRTFDLNTGCEFATKSQLMSKHSGSGYQPTPYTPDFELRLVGGGQVYVETKAERLLEQTPEVERLPGIFAAFGKRLILVTDRVLTPVLAANARHLRPYHGRSVDDVSADMIRDAVDARSEFADCLARGISQGELLTAVVSGLLKTDITVAHFNRHTLLEPAHGACKHLEIISL